MKYKIGDRIRIKSIDWYNEHKDMNGNVCYGCEDIFNPCTARHCGQVLTIKHINSLGWYEVEEEAVFVNDGMIEGLVEEKTFIKLTGKAIKNNEIVISIGECTLPEGYIFKDENGNVINETKIVLEKKEYPKTFRECCEILDIDALGHDVDGYKWEILAAFQNLLICRDAYWKIAGEEMGLGKPWEPDWTKADERKYCIVNTEGNITKWVQKTTNKIIAFPTPEMQDAFKENFDKDLETCKELL